MNAQGNHSIVAMCVPKHPLTSDMLVSCARQSHIVVWSSPNEYVSYFHSEGVRYVTVWFQKLLFFVVFAHALAFCANSCVAAISTTVITGDWEGSVLFYDLAKNCQSHLADNVHPGGVSAVTVFSSNEEENVFAGLVYLFIFDLEHYVDF
jgi:hypothetical protein